MQVLHVLTKIYKACHVVSLEKTHTIDPSFWLLPNDEPEQTLLSRDPKL